MGVDDSYDAWRTHVASLREAVRDEFGLTEGQREGAEIQADTIELDWRPRVLFLANRLGITEELAIEYNRLLLESNRANDQRRQADAYEAWNERDKFRREYTEGYLHKVEKALDATLEEVEDDEDWKGDHGRL